MNKSYIGLSLLVASTLTGLFGGMNPNRKSPAGTAGLGYGTRCGGLCLALVYEGAAHDTSPQFGDINARLLQLVDEQIRPLKL